MRKIGVVPAPGLGDALIMRIVSHHLRQSGYLVRTLSTHDFGPWQEKEPPLEEFDALFLQHDNSERAKELYQEHPLVYGFFGAHKEEKHGKLRKTDYVCDRDVTMVENVRRALKQLFGIEASGDNGLKVPQGLEFRKHNRLVIHNGARDTARIWPHFEKVASRFEAVYLPAFPTLAEMMTFLYESSAFVGNDSGPAHAASFLGLPNVVVARDKRHMKLWRPGWRLGKVATPLWGEWPGPRKVIKLLTDIV